MYYDMDGGQCCKCRRRPKEACAPQCTLCICFVAGCLCPLACTCPTPAGLWLTHPHDTKKVDEAYEHLLPTEFDYATTGAPPPTRRSVFRRESGCVDTVRTDAPDAVVSSAPSEPEPELEPEAKEPDEPDEAPTPASPMARVRKSIADLAGGLSADPPPGVDDAGDAEQRHRLTSTDTGAPSPKHSQSLRKSMGGLMHRASMAQSPNALKRSLSGPAKVECN